MGSSRSGQAPAGPRSGRAPFQAHVELLHFFLTQREAIVDRIQGILNAQRKPTDYLQNGPLLSRQFEDCFFTLAGITAEQSRLRGQLEAAHWEDGFRPRNIPGLHNGLTDPAEMMIRGFHLWRQTRWPGRNGRVHYAHTLFNLYMIRCLELLSMRLWDDASSSANARLADLQGVLDALWQQAPADQPVLVRDAHWLIQLAQSPATDDLGAYFTVAGRIAAAFPVEDRLDIHRAGVRMTAGHLRSQTRYYATKMGVALDDPGLIRTTRTTNALDFALLVQELVPLLEAYERACRDDDRPQRLELADAICQGVSADPELFLNRVELLGAYSMIEYLFITTDRDGQVVYTSIGQRHIELLAAYTALIARLAKPLHDDCPSFTPIAGAYSPFGVLYGFSSDLVEHMAFKALQPDAITHFGLEDVFAAGDASKLAWVSGWRKLPHLTPDVAQRFDYPQQFAEDIHTRLAQALHRRAADEGTNTAPTIGRLFVVTGDGVAGADASRIPDLPARYIGASDPQLVAAGKAERHDESRLASDRQEGRSLLSYRTAGGWVSIAKTVLTEVLGAGHDATLTGLPPAAVGALKLMYPTLAVIHEPSPS